ncbi:MAG: hypothetical protein U0893_09580 [Chloroflexota bacterium]
MVIQLSIERTEPLTGSAADECGAPIHFVGWMAMLRAISDLVDSRAGEARRAGHADRSHPDDRTGHPGKAVQADETAQPSQVGPAGRDSLVEGISYLTLVQPTEELREQA